jgi:hypothetical protein
VGGSADAFEREADQVADRLMRQVGVTDRTAALDDTSSHARGPSPLRITPLTHGGGTGVSPALTPDLEARIVSLQSHGSPLPAAERLFFERLMGVDLGRVRIHTDTNAIDTARAVQARAYTIGSNIAFDQGEYRPGTERSGFWPTNSPAFSNGRDHWPHSTPADATNRKHPRSNTRRHHRLQPRLASIKEHREFRTDRQ